MKESVDSFDHDKKASLAAQKLHYIERHKQILDKLTERFADKLTVSLKPLQEKNHLISTENEILKKKVSLLQKERNFFESENIRLKDQPAVRVSLKGVQLEPIDLSRTTKKSSTTLPSLVPYMDRLKMIREAGRSLIEPQMF